jgi:hypothetical protein
VYLIELLKLGDALIRMSKNPLILMKLGELVGTAFLKGYLNFYTKFCSGPYFYEIYSRIGDLN